MSLFLHAPNSPNELSDYYQRAFSNASELYLITAYLTDWNETLVLNKECKSFRLIIGKDFGITRKEACKKVMKWLPSARKSEFLVADGIKGFHPKAIFWREKDGKCFAIIGSSNLTRAAFESNYEANIYTEIRLEDFQFAKEWLNKIENQSIVVSEDWLSVYVEGTNETKGGSRKSRDITIPEASVFKFELPRPKGMLELIKRRRAQLEIYNKTSKQLTELFNRCKNGEISSLDFYNELPRYWSIETGSRLQHLGWERQGRNSDFKALSESYLAILSASAGERDEVVRLELDKLAENGITTRKSFLSEMLCLRFPKLYPVLNAPVQTYLKKIKLRAPKGSSEGAKYIDLAKKLRSALQQNPDHPAKNIAELDAVIWLKYGKKKVKKS